MARLELSFLGPLRVVLDGRPVDGLGYDKVRALLAYLAVEGDRSQRRETLAALLWPDHSDKEARHGLSQALTTLRHALGDATASPPYLLASRDAIGFNPASDHWVDVTAFVALREASDRHPHRQLAVCAACADRLAQATALYRGDFLTGYSLAGCEEFEDWVRAQRERLRRRCLVGLEHLATFHERRGDYAQAREAVARQLELDTW